MTSEEKQEIINAVLAALRTNSKSIDQLTPVSEMSDTDFLELNGGRKVSYGVLFANHMSNDEAQEAWEYLDTKKVDKDLRGLVEVHQAPVVFLDAMGILDGHSLNGGDGLEYRPDYKQIFDFPDGLFGAPKAGAVYISKNNFKKFVWNGTDLEELKADECPLFVDYSEPVAFATLPVGGSYYVPSSHKIAVKIDASNTKTYDPLPDALYFFRDKGKVYTWNSSTNKWVPVSSDINVVNNLTEGGEADALSAEQGKVLKGLIDNIGTGSIAAFAQYAVFESVSALPATGAATTGYIVGNHIYAYVGTGGDTRDGKYQDLGALEAAGVSVTTAEDGTFTIHAGGNDYTVNLNHTHPNMCKLVVCEESGLPSTLDNSTIYAITDSGETEIEKLIIRGMEFVGGGVPDTGEPMISSPSNGSTINLGTNEGSGVSKTITIKGKNLTGDLTVAVGTGLTISYGQSTGQSSVTIPMAQALLGAQVTIAYSGTGALDDGSLVISHDNAVLASVVVVVVVAPVQVAGVKLTGTQWLETDYHVNANTKVVMRATFATNSFTQTTSNRYFYLSCREPGSSDTGSYRFFVGIEQSNPSGPFNFCGNTGGSSAIQSIARASLLTPNSTIEIYGTTMSFIPNGGTAITKALSPAISSMANPMVIGYFISGGEPRIFNTLDLTIHELTISEGNETKRHYVPATLQGVPGLHDTVTGAFISSMVDGAPLEVVQS